MKLNYLILLLTFYSYTLLGQNWTGNVNSDWNNSANWSATPVNGGNIIIDPALYTGNAVAPEISSNSTFNPATIIIQNGGILTIEANISTSDDVELLGTGSGIVINNGTLNVNPGGGGRLIIDLGSEMTINGGTVDVDERFIAGEDAVVTINGGTVTSGERLLMDLGGTFIQNGGSVTVAQTFAMADGNANGASSYYLNNGQLSITGEMAFENEAGNFQPIFHMTNGTLTLNGNMIWFGAAPGLGQPRCILEGGNTTINGLIQNLPLSTVQLYLEVSGTAVLDYSGSLIETIHVNDSITLWNDAELNISGVNTINNSGVFYAHDTTQTNFDGNTVLSGTGSYQFGYVEVVILDQVSLSSDISIGGALEANGAFVPNNQHVTMNGHGPQTIASVSTIPFVKLTINNTINEVILISPVTISDTLFLLNGNLIATAPNSLEVLDNATSVGSSALSFVHGPMIKTGDDPFVFPVGKTNFYAPIGISAPSSTTSQYSAEFFNQTPSNSTMFTAPLSGISPSLYWNLDKTIGADQVEVSLFWDNAAASGINNCSQVTIANWTGSTWDNIISNPSGICTGSGSGLVTTDASVSADGLFTFGYFGNVTTELLLLCDGDSLNINGTFYSTDQTVLNTYLDILGNDSLVVSNIDIVSIPVTSLNNDICFGDTVFVGTSFYTSSGIYFDTLTSFQGCDSIIQSQLNVTQINTNISYISAVVLEAVSGADTYQWLDCNNGFSMISGAQNAVYSATSNGSYACEITQNGCVDTTVCLLVDQVGIADYESVFSFYPNPVSESLVIQMNHYSEAIYVSIRDLTGRLMINLQSAQAKEIIDVSNLPGGIYSITIFDGNQISTRKFVKL